MADTSFTAQQTTIVAAWLNQVNLAAFQGRSPNAGTTTGAVDAQILTLATGSLYSGQQNGDTFGFIAGFTNTGAATLQIVAPGGALAAAPLQMNGAALTGGEVIAGQPYVVAWATDAWELVSLAGTVFGTALLQAADATAVRTLLSLGALALLNTVDTAQIDDAAVTVAKIDKGTANQYLRTNSAGTAVEWRSATQQTTTTLTSGSGTYNTPAGCTCIVVEGWGGGGAGGGGDGTNRGTGGGGGGYFKKTYTSPAASYSYSVGAAAAAVGQGSGGTAGNGTTFDTCTANGGAAGLVSNGGAQGGVAGGTATGGDENIQGGASTTLEGSAAQLAGVVSFGGDSPRGGFGGKTNVATGGQIPGGGGSCANGTGNSGAGARGQIVITEYYS